MKKGFLQNLGFLTLTIGIGAGCTTNDTVPEPESLTPGPAVISQRTSADEPLLVTIEPNPATVNSDLTAVSNDTSVAYHWSINGSSVPGGTSRTLPQGSFSRGQIVTVTVALNGQEASSSVTIQNSPPRATGVSLDRDVDKVHQGVELTAMPQGVDPDGDDIRWDYQWRRNGEPVPGGSAQTLAADAFERGDRLTVMVTPWDAEGPGEPYTPGEITVPNGAPEFFSQPPAVTGGAEYVYQVRAVDPEGDPLSYRLITAPNGMTLDGSTGTIRWSLVGAAAGRQPIEIEVDDGMGGRTSQPFELDIAPPEG